MALKSSREGLRKELVDYLGNLIVDDNLRNEIIKVVGNNFVTSESLNEAVNNLTIQITTESGERIEADDTLQNNIIAETTSREAADSTLQNNINAEITARQEAITNLEGMIGTSDLQMDLLWTNASPTSDFASQTISLDLSRYKAIIITTNTTNIDWQVSRDQIFVINSEKKVLYGGYDKNSFRYFTISATGIVFETGYYQSSYGTSKTANDGLSTPYRIYGIK